MLDTIMAENRVIPEPLDILASLSQPTITRRQRKEVVMEQVKRCTKCEEVKSLEEFHNKTDSKDGKSGTCKSCSAVYDKDWHAQNRDREATRSARRRKQDPEKNKRLCKAWRGRFPERQKAEHLVRTALAQGKLVRPDVCEDCGETAKVHGHHDDYSKPLEVRWLCRSCHRKEGRK